MKSLTHRWHFLLLHIVVGFFKLPLVPGAFVSDPVFIATGKSSSDNSSRGYHKSNANARPNGGSLSATVVTATDAAVAINSVRFMEMLTEVKNTADLKTYTRPSIRATTDNKERASSSDHHDVSTKETAYSWSIIARVLGKDATEGTSDSQESADLHECSVASREATKSSPCPLHETVSEYLGRLWFLPESKGGIKFREIIRVVSLSTDGNSSTVECDTQYHNGEKWVDCCRIICQFVSVPWLRSGEGEEERKPASDREGEMKVRMDLDCDLLIWLPLPGLASKAIQKKIGSVFESVAINFFEELALT